MRIWSSVSVVHVSDVCVTCMCETVRGRMQLAATFGVTACMRDGTVAMRRVGGGASRQAHTTPATLLAVAPPRRWGE